MTPAVLPPTASPLTTPPLLLRLEAVDCVVDGWPVLRGLNLRVYAGERIALVGPNGSGKTTLLKLLHGLLPPSQGQLHWATPAPRQAMVFQRPHMLNTSVRSHVALALWAQRMPWAQARAQALQVLAQVGLAASANQPARTLSGGQQQRLALARAWALQPDMLLLDEPTANLDPPSKPAVERLITQWLTPPEPRSEPTPEPASPRTLLLASHNLGQVKRLASRVLYLEQGRLCADLDLHTFFHTPLEHSHPQAHAFLQGERA